MDYNLHISLHKEELILTSESSFKDGLELGFKIKELNSIKKQHNETGEWRIDKLLQSL